MNAMTGRAQFAAEISVGLVLAAWTATPAFPSGIGGLLGIGLVLWMRWRAHRADPEPRWERHLAGALAIPLAFVSYGSVLGHYGLQFTSSLWLFLPGALVASLLITRPRAGLGALAAFTLTSWWILEAEPIFGLLGLPALVATVVHALRTRTLRLPVTYVAAGVVLALACAAITYEHLFIGDLHERIQYTALPPGTSARLPLEAAMLVAAVETLRGRTAGLLALVPLTFAYGVAASELTPHFHYGMHCMPIIVHPLDAQLGEPIAYVALALALLWAAPMWRWVRAD
jgi:hypothetical protein